MGLTYDDGAAQGIVVPLLLRLADALAACPAVQALCRSPLAEADQADTRTNQARARSMVVVAMEEEDAWGGDTGYTAEQLEAMRCRLYLRPSIEQALVVQRADTSGGCPDEGGPIEVLIRRQVSPLEIDDGLAEPYLVFADLLLAIPAQLQREADARGLRVQGVRARLPGWNDPESVRGQGQAITTELVVDWGDLGQEA